MVPGGPVFIHLPTEQFSVTDDGVVNGKPLIEYYWNRVGNMELNKQLTSRMFLYPQYENSDLFYNLEDGFGYFINYNDKFTNRIGHSKKSIKTQTQYIILLERQKKNKMNTTSLHLNVHINKITIKQNNNGVL